MADAGRGFSVPGLHMNETVKDILSSKFDMLTALLSEVQHQVPKRRFVTESTAAQNQLLPFAHL